MSNRPTFLGPDPDTEYTVLKTALAFVGKVNGGDRIPRAIGMDTPAPYFLISAEDREAAKKELCDNIDKLFDYIAREDAIEERGKEIIREIAVASIEEDEKEAASRRDPRSSKCRGGTCRTDGTEEDTPADGAQEDITDEVAEDMGWGKTDEGLSDRALGDGPSTGFPPGGAAIAGSLADSPDLPGGGMDFSEKPTKEFQEGEAKTVKPKTDGPVMEEVETDVTEEKAEMPEPSSVPEVP